MIESKTHFTVEKNERKYILICDPSSPLGELHDAVYEIKSQIVEKINEVSKAEKQSKEEVVNDDQQAES